MEELLAHLFLARELTHRAHLATRSYASHMALGDFYDDIDDAADAIAEAYQGRFGLLGQIPILTADQGAPILDVLKRHVEWIASQRYIAVAESETPIQNLIDEAVAVYLRAIYKLEFLS